jgi:hypothetical protein
VVVVVVVVQHTNLQNLVNNTLAHNLKNTSKGTRPFSTCALASNGFSVGNSLTHSRIFFLVSMSPAAAVVAASLNHRAGTWRRGWTGRSKQCVLFVSLPPTSFFRPPTDDVYSAAI